MATQKPISTITYNSESFLKEKLEELYEAHIIQAYQYIFHVGEDGDKDHIHLRVEPNKKLDPMELTSLLREYDPSHPTKPLGCRPWRPSKEEDWYLYSVHDPEYLALKYGGGEKGEKLPYSYTDIKTSEFYDLDIAFIRAKASLKHSSTSIAQRIRSGEDPMKMLLTGENVFTINAVTRALSDHDYKRLSQELADAQRKLDSILDALERANLSVVCQTDGSLKIESGRGSTSSPSPEGCDFSEAKHSP